jgi:hypothetical protein
LKRSEKLRRRALPGAGRERFEDLASILWSEANRKSARCTETVSFEKRNRGLSAEIFKEQSDQENKERSDYIF